ncbi:MAG: amidohydrolase family protein [Armatimonadetes bacterium]|nr:amidohydrolase family protein [Armatimonadota bacterium]
MSTIIDINTRFGPLPTGAADLSVDDLVALMHQNEVQACCTLSTVGILLDASMGNAATNAAASETRSLIPTATLNPQAWFGDNRAVDSLREAGFRMLRFFPEDQGWQVDYEPFRQLASLAARAGMPIMVDVRDCGAASRIARATRDYGCTIILAGVHERSLSEAAALIAGDARLHVETSRLVAVGSVRMMIDAAGADRVLYGSGAPAQPMSGALGILHHAQLSDTEAELVLGGNAARLLGL